MRRALAALGLLALWLPASAVVTLVLLPLWRVVEERAGIESIGHSGPAGWCFIAVFALGAACGAVPFLRGARPPRG